MSEFFNTVHLTYNMKCMKFQGDGYLPQIFPIFNLFDVSTFSFLLTRNRHFYKKFILTFVKGGLKGKQYLHSLRTKPELVYIDRERLLLITYLTLPSVRIRLKYS